jgi:hypothetical protein
MKARGPLSKRFLACDVDEPIFRSIYFGKVKEIMEKAGTSPLYWCCNNNQNKGKRR